MNSYLILSSSKHLAFEQIKANDYDVVVTYDLYNNSFDEVLNELMYFNSLDSAKHIIVNNSYFFSSVPKEEISDEMITTLLNVLKNLEPNVFIYFITDTIDRRKKITKTLINDHTFIDLTIDYKNIYNFINQYVLKNQYKIDYNTVSLLVNRFGLNFDYIVNELDKLFLYSIDTKNIIYDQAVEVLSNSINENIFKFFDHLVNKDYKEALLYLKDLETLKEEETKLIILLQKEYKNLLFFLYYKNQNYAAMDIMKNLNIPEWKLKKLQDLSTKHSEDDLLNYLYMLSNLDEQIKKGQIDKEIAIKYFMIKAI